MLHPDIRKDVQGLRALAVLGVILFHLNAAWLPGGFVGHVTFKNFSKIQLFTNAPFHDGQLIYMDAHHLNEVGAVRLAQAVGDQI